VLSETETAEALKIGEATRSGVETLGIPHEGAADGTVIISVGVAVAVAVPSADDSADEILRRADKALYDAKAKGRNQIQYRPS